MSIGAGACFLAGVRQPGLPQLQSRLSRPGSLAVEGRGRQALRTDDEPQGMLQLGPLERPQGLAEAKVVCGSPGDLSVSRP